MRDQYIRDLDLKTEEDVRRAIASLRSLKEHEGWLYFVKILDASIEMYKEYILDPPVEATDEEVESCRSNLRILRQMKEKPDDILARLEEGEKTEEQDLDPYHTVNTIEEGSTEKERNYG